MTKGPDPLGSRALPRPPLSVITKLGLPWLRPLEPQLMALAYASSWFLSSSQYPVYYSGPL